MTLLVVSAGSLSAATTSWDFSNAGDYEVSDSNAIEIADGVAKLKLVDGAGIVGSYSTLPFAQGVTLSSDGNTAYVSYIGNNGMVILDVSDREDPVVIGTYNNSGNGNFDSTTLSSDENTLYIGTSESLEIVDITDPTTPVLIGSYSSDLGIYSAALSSDEDILYISSRNGVPRNQEFKIEVLDITDPSSPSSIGEYSPGYDSSTIILSSDDSKLYSSNETDGFVILDITDPSNPSLLGSHDTDDFGIYSFALSGDENTAYISGFNELIVVDISDPTDPVVTDTYDILDASTEIRLSPLEDYAFVTGNDGMDIIDLNAEIYSASEYLSPSDSIEFTTTVDSFAETLGANNEGVVTYQVSPDNGDTWYYWGGNWYETSATDGNETSSVGEVNTNIATLDSDGGDFLFRAYLNSDGNEQVELDEITVEGSFVVAPEPEEDENRSSTRKSSRRLSQAQVDAIFGTQHQSSASNEIRQLQLKLISLITQLLAMMKG